MSENIKTYQIAKEKETYSIEISLQNNQQKEISMKLFNKNNKINPQYLNSFSYDYLIKLSKAFKVCDTIEEIYSLICKKCENNEINLSFSEKADIIFTFKLPNDKIEELKLSLKEGTTSGDNSLDKICQKIALLEEKNKILEKEINILKIENEKLKSKQGANNVESKINNNEDKIFFDVMSDIFYVSKYKLSRDLVKHLEQFGLSEEYKRELYKRFNSKIRKIYDVKTDGDKLMTFMTKVFGKKNIVTFHSLSAEDEYINVQIAFLNGKFEFLNNYFNFNNTELYTYGDYQNIDGDYCYTSFRSQNSKLYAKIEFDCIYIIFYEHGNINFIAKIRDNFVNNPVLFIDEGKSKIEEFFENNPEDKVPELFSEYETRELNVSDLVIYEMIEE